MYLLIFTILIASNTNQLNNTNSFGIVKHGLVHHSNNLMHKVIRLNFSSAKKKINDRYQSRKSQPMSLPVQVINEVELLCPANKKQMRKLN